MLADHIKKQIRDVPDFPKPGILFKDITPIFKDPKLCLQIVDEMAEQMKRSAPDAIAGIESRGFLLGPMLAAKLGLPFIMIRKAGKLPYKKISYEYSLEYGTATIEMHIDAVQKGMRVIVHDDLLATGGTAIAAAHLIGRQQGIIAGFSFIVELDFLKGRDLLLPISSNIVSMANF